MHEHGVDTRLTRPPGDQLGRLRPEVENRYDLVVRERLKISVSAVCHARSARGLVAPTGPARGLKRAAYAASLSASIALCPGCIPPIPEGFDSPDPTKRLVAITDAGARTDANAIPDLIRQLESSDPAARMLAIRSLERITGETLGYDYASPGWERAAAVERWRRWADQRGFLQEPATSSPED